MIAHGSLDSSYRSVSAFLKAHSDLAENCPVKLGLDCSHDDTIPELMVDYAAQTNEDRLVLLSSERALRVNKNVKAVLEPDISRAQVALFGQLVERDLMPSFRLD